LFFKCVIIILSLIIRIKKLITMKNNKKGFAGIGIILAIIAVLAIGGGAYYIGKKSNTLPKVEENNLQQEEQNQNITTKNQVKNYFTYSSITYGYTIGYSGIDVSKVYIEGDGKKVNLFPNQSNIDSLEIVDSSYTMPNYISLVGTVNFGNNQYKKFKDNITSRHTYYLKSGLKNDKSMFISVENDSDSPSYLDLSSLVIQ